LVAKKRLAREAKKKMQVKRAGVIIAKKMAFLMNRDKMTHFPVRWK